MLWFEQATQISIMNYMLHYTYYFYVRIERTFSSSNTSHSLLQVFMTTSETTAASYGSCIILILKLVTDVTPAACLDLNVVLMHLDGVLGSYIGALHI